MVPVKWVGAPSERGIQSLCEKQTSCDRLGGLVRQWRRMNLIQGWDRQQAHLLPERLEDYVGPANLVRFLDA